MRRILSVVVLSSLFVLVAIALFVVLNGGLRALLNLVFGERIAAFSTIIFIVLLLLLPWRRLGWNRPYAIVGNADINAPPERVWEVIEIRDRFDTFQSTITHIEAVNTSAGHYRLHWDDNLRVPGEDLPALDILVEDREAPHYLRYRAVNPEDMPLWGKDLRTVEYRLEPVDPGGTRITTRETLARVGVLTLLSLLFLNPCRDSMQRLKAYVEGTPDPSVLGAEARSIREGRSSLINSALVAAIVTVVLVAFVVLYAVSAMI